MSVKVESFGLMPDGREAKLIYKTSLTSPKERILIVTKIERDCFTSLLMTIFCKVVVVNSWQVSPPVRYKSKKTFIHDRRKKTCQDALLDLSYHLVCWKVWGLAMTVMLLHWRSWNRKEDSGIAMTKFLIQILIVYCYFPLPCMIIIIV